MNSAGEYLMMWDGGADAAAANEIGSRPKTGEGGLKETQDQYVETNKSGPELLLLLLLSCVLPFSLQQTRE